MPQLTRLAAFAKKNAGRLATGAVVCLCAAALLLPGVLGAARQAQLLGQVQPRPAVAGVPSEQARSIPLLYDLYRRQAGDPLPQADTAAEAGEAAAVAADLAGRLRALAGAGLLTDAQRDAVLRLLAELPGRPDANILSGGDGSFAAAACFGPDGGVSMTWHRDTGGVVELSFWGGALPQQADPAAMLAAWRAALGLDMLADWAEPALKDGAACRSDSAQLYLYCVESVDSLRMEMVVLTADAVLPGSADTAPTQK